VATIDMNCSHWYCRKIIVDRLGNSIYKICSSDVHQASPDQSNIQHPPEHCLQSTLIILPTSVYSNHHDSTTI